jgi:DNA-binding Lrp family transcriptional regulator
MDELIELLKDGKSRTPEMLAEELNTSVEKVKRDIDFLEHAGVIKRIVFSGAQNAGHSCTVVLHAAQAKRPVPGACPRTVFRTWAQCGKS